MFELRYPGWVTDRQPLLTRTKRDDEYSQPPGQRHAHRPVSSAGRHTVLDVDPERIGTLRPNPPPDLNRAEKVRKFGSPLAYPASFRLPPHSLANAEKFTPGGSLRRLVGSEALRGRLLGVRCRPRQREILHRLDFRLATGRWLDGAAASLSSCPGVPPQSRLHRRIPRRRSVLRHQRISHHQPSAGGVRRDRDDPARPVLHAPGAAASAGAIGAGIGPTCRLR